MFHPATNTLDKENYGLSSSFSCRTRGPKLVNKNVPRRLLHGTMPKVSDDHVESRRIRPLFCSVNFHPVFFTLGKASGYIFNYSEWE